ncbi:hypothetical protein ACQPZJ_06255 [Actinoplanes sp. CA-054009]
MDVLRELDGAVVQDVHVTGYLERDYGAPQFRPSAGVAYLDLGGRFLRIDGARSPGLLTLSLVAEMTVPPELVDDDDEFLTASLGRLFFDRGAGMPITRIRYAVPDEARAAPGVVRCAEFQFGASASLFFDPVTFELLRLAVSRGYDDWRRTERPRDMEIYGSVAEHVWEPSIV